MIPTNWLLTITEALITKIGETITSEAYKEWITKSKSLKAQRLLLSLYNDLSALENSAKKFMKLLEDYLKKERSRKSSSANPKGDKWHLSWSRALAKQAKDVDEYMQLVMGTLSEQMNAMSIHAPEIVDDLKHWQNIPSGESFIAPIVATSMGEITLDGSPSEDSITLDELLSIMEKLKEAVHSLGETKKSLATFIKGNLKFEDVL